MVKSSSSSSSRSNMEHPSSGHSTKKCQYKGVRMRSWGSWVSEIRAPNQKTRIWLGSYSNPEAAARAYDAALRCLKGSTAALNFPDSPFHHLPSTSSTTPMSPKSIQRIAAAAASATTTTTTTTTSSSSETTTPITSTTSSPYPSPSFDVVDDEMLAMSSESGVFGLVEDETLSNHCPIDQPLEVDFGVFESPKFMDQMLNHWGLVDATQIDDLDDFDDIRLWSFC